MQIQMVDLVNQYLRLQKELDGAIRECVQSGRYIGGEQVSGFCGELATVLGSNHFIGCANGTDALQIALMALGLRKGDEVIVPAFTYAAPVEVVALMGLKPLFMDVSKEHFNIDLNRLDGMVSSRTKVIIPVHLFGQSADMEAVLDFASVRDLIVIEDNAQSIMAEYEFSNGTSCMTGTMGDLGTFSFFPAKNLGCFGDGGGIATQDPVLAEKISLIANHGQTEKYYHSVVGVNSRLDALQATILRVKLKYIEEFMESRRQAAALYFRCLEGIDEITTPGILQNGKHVFHQFTIRVHNGKRDQLMHQLKSKSIPCAVYYPLPLYKQKAYKKFWDGNVLPNAEELCREVLSLPMHTELTDEQIEYITNEIQKFFK